MYIKLIIILTCLSLVSSNCPAQNALSDLQTGSVDLTMTTNTKSPLVYVMRFDKPFSSLPQISLTFHNFDTSNIPEKQMIIKGQAPNPAAVRITFSYDKSVWRRVKLSYWATTRPDITLGQGMGSFGSLTGGSRSTVVKLSRPIANYKQSITRVYLNGFVLNSVNQISIRVYNSELSANSLKVIAVVGKNTDLKEVYFSYIVFSPKTAQFASYGGGFTEKNFDGTKVYDINKIIYNTPYVFYGFIGIQLAGKGPLGFASDVDNELFLKLSSRRNIDEFTLSYIALGISPANACQNCQQSLAYENTCLNSCPSGSYLHTYRDQGKACRTCPQQYNFEVNRQRNGCSCKAGFEEKNGYCQKSATASSAPTDNFSFQASQQSSQQQSVQQPVQQPIQQQPSVQINENTQSFIPNPSAPQPTIPQSTTPTFEPEIMKPEVPPPPEYEAKSCSHIPNSYWTGYRCACRVGYITKSGVCTLSNIQRKPEIFKPAEFIHKISRLYTVIQCQKAYEMLEGNVCVCIEGYQRGVSGNCEPNIPVEPIDCPENAFELNGECVCSPGFIQVNGLCILECPQNSYNNGFGKCVCETGYYDDNGICKAGKPCPPYSSRNYRGECVCDAGYQLYDGYCSRCPNGQIWVAFQNRCITPCGLNEEINPATNTCKCKKGYGIFEGSCKKCPSTYFEHDGYCVSCPLFSYYDNNKGKCICNNGLSPNENGFCVSGCQKNQVFDDNLGRCKCLEGLGLSNGECIICPLGIDYSTGECKKGCGNNEIYLNNKCVCKDGYGFNKNKLCVDCQQNGGFLIDGFCASCPSGFIHNGQKCSCKPGFSEVNGKCVQNCQNGQAVDYEGNCYWCPINQVQVNGKCECKVGYEKIGQICQLKCGPHQVVVNGLCAQCALNTVYDPLLGSCVCADGYYKNNYGFCQKTVLKPVTCDPGFYFDKDQGCISCPYGCKTCDNANTCTSCTAPGYSPVGAECVPKCGDGFIIYGRQECDDKNNKNGDGCSSSCKVQNGWVCSGNPSSCQKINTGPECGDGVIEGSEACDDKNTYNGDGCSSSCQIQNGWKCTGVPSSCSATPVTPQNRGMKLVNTMTNFNNVFVLLETQTAFSFANEAEMRAFMNYKFPDAGTEPSSAYCLQQPAQPKVFQCLLIYASGLPNREYGVDFSYNRGGKSGFMKVKVDPLDNAFASRSLL